MEAHGLLIDYEWCSGCHTCEVACQMEHKLPKEQFGIKISEVGTWEYAPEKWQYAYVPIPTDQCDLCASRVSEGKEPSCVHHCQSKCMTYGPVSKLAEKLAEKPKQALFCPVGNNE